MSDLHLSWREFSRIIEGLKCLQQDSLLVFKTLLCKYQRYPSLINFLELSREHQGARQLIEEAMVVCTEPSVLSIMEELQYVPNITMCLSLYHKAETVPNAEWLITAVRAVTRIMQYEQSQEVTPEIRHSFQLLELRDSVEKYRTAQPTALEAAHNLHYAVCALSPKLHSQSPEMLEVIRRAQDQIAKSIEEDVSERGGIDCRPTIK